MTLGVHGCHRLSFAVASRENVPQRWWVHSTRTMSRTGRPMVTLRTLISSTVRILNLGAAAWRTGEDGIRSMVSTEELVSTWDP